MLDSVNSFGLRTLRARDPTAKSLASQLTNDIAGYDEGARWFYRKSWEICCWEISIQRSNMLRISHLILEILFYI